MGNSCLFSAPFLLRTAIGDDPSPRLPACSDFPVAVYKSFMDRCHLSGTVADTSSNWCEGLYEAQAAQIILYGRALGLSHAEAEDVLQETFVALMRLPEPDKPLHYCLRTFRNRALNYKRGLWRRLMREVESRRWFEASAGETAQELAAMKCLARLPREQREVIVLKIWHQHTFDEIARLLEESPNTVAGRYRYGLQKLKNWLKVDDYEQLGTSGEPFAFLETASPIAGS
jgi:RNA polymerase sigma-70 factor (ECF subfamily)